MTPSSTLLGTKTSRFFYMINRGAVVCGLPNFWITDVKLPRLFACRAFEILVKLITLCFSAFVLAEIGALFTQNDLSEKQSFDRLIFCTSHPLLYAFWVTVAHHKDKVKEITFQMCASRELYNDLAVEAQMLRKAKQFSVASVLSCAVTMVSYAVDGVIQVIQSAYVTVISLTICLSHQYKNLQSYFYKLEAIFSEKNLNQDEKEEKYEKALKFGIKMHSESLQ
ncbi:unnamed protein product, partial [Iphiclides podalirius]